MRLNDLFDHVCQATPLPSMARMARGKVFPNEAVDGIFREDAVDQYEGDLAFSG